MFSLMRRQDRCEVTFFRGETEEACRCKLSEVLPSLEDGSSILLLKAGRGIDLEILGTYLRPPQMPVPQFARTSSTRSSDQRIGR